MRKIMRMFVVLLFASACAAQVSNPSIIPVTNAPSGACTSGLPNQQVVSTGTQYSCQNGTWGAIGGGSGSGTVNAGTLNQIGYYAGAGTAISGTSTPTSTFRDIGGAFYNLKSYGATGDGTTNDCTAVTNWIAAYHAAGGGQLFVPFGKYNLGSSCHLTIADSGSMVGVGSCYILGTTNCGSQFLSTDTSGVLFTVTADSFLFDDVAMTNTATATAGSAIFTNAATNYLQNVSIRSCSISGFYDNANYGTGAAWMITNSRFGVAVHDSIKIQNTLAQDSGDWAVIGNFIEAGTNAGIEVLGAGGGKIEANKIIGQNVVQDGVKANSASTTQLIIAGNSIEQLAGSSIHIVQWSQVTVANNYLSNAGTAVVSPLLADNVTSLTFMGGQIIPTQTSNPDITVTSGTGIIGPYIGHSAVANVNTSGGMKDYSMNLSGGFTVPSGTINVGDPNVAPGASTLNLWTSSAGNFQSGITANYAAGGMLFQLPRDFATSGYHFQNHAKDTDLLYIDSTAGGTSKALNQFNFAATAVLPQLETSVTTVQANWLLKSTLNSASGHAALTIDKGTSGAEATVDYSVAGSLKWRIGMHGNANWSLVDQANSGHIPFLVTAAAPTNSLAVDASGNVTIKAGTNTVVRCLTAGALPIGALTIDSTQCGTSSDTGLRVN